MVVGAGVEEDVVGAIVVEMGVVVELVVTTGVDDEVVGGGSVVGGKSFRHKPCPLQFKKLQEPKLYRERRI